MTNPSRYDALKEEIRRFTPITYVQTQDVHDWLTFLQTALSKTRTARLTTLVASTPTSDEEIAHIEHNLAKHLNEDQKFGITPIYALAHARLSDQMIHVLKTLLLKKGLRPRDFEIMVVIINDEPPPPLHFPDIVTIQDRGRTRDEHREHLSFFNPGDGRLPVEELLDLLEGMSFHQVERIVSNALVLTQKTRDQPIPLDVFKLVAKDIVPAYGSPA